MKEIISSLDVGSSTMKLVVGEVYKNEVHILAKSVAKSKGVKKGIIVNPEETLISLKELFSRCEDVLNIKIDKVIVTVPSYYSEFIECDGNTTITNEEGIIESHDIIRSMQACVYNKIPSNKEMVSIMPMYFVLDDNTKTSSPINKKAAKLGCKAIVSLVPKKNVYTTFSVLDNMGIEVTDICFGSLADYYEFRTPELDKKNGAIINIGEDKTEVSIITKGILTDTENLEMGARNIDKDICYMYDISKKDSVNLKEKFALSHKRNASTSWSQEVLTNTHENIKINQYEISEIIYSRIKEVLDLSKKQINLLTKKEISYIIITGGTTEIKDFDLVVEEVFGKDASTYKIKEIGCRHNMYSSVLGLIKYYHSKLELRNKVASTVDEGKQGEITNVKNKSNNTILGKIYGYFFNN